MLYFFIGIFFILLLYYVYEQQQTKRIREISSNIPGPKTYPFVGSAFEFGRNSVELMENLQKFTAQYGKIFRVWMGPTLYVAMYDAKDIEVILTSSVHLNKPQIYQFLEKWLGSGLISAPASKWKTQRKILTPAFHFKILETYIGIFNDNINIMIDLLEKEIGKDKFDICPYIDHCTLDVICETAMATSIHAQLNEESQFTKSLKEVSNAVLMRAFTPWLFPDFLFNLSPLGRRFKKNLDYINDYVDKVIVQKKKKLEESKDYNTVDEVTEESDYYGTKKRYTFLDLLLTYACDPSIHLSDADIRDEVNTFMFAGHDTTASTIGFAIYLLGSHPDVQAKVVEELKSVFGDSSRNPTYQELNGLKYLEQVVKETLRLFPAVPYIGRKLYEDVKLPSGYTLPAGSAATLLLFKLQRDPKVFPEPDKFNPDNFLPERMVGRFAFSHAPFSAGPRNCIGQRFAMLEIKATLARLLRTYKIRSMAPEPVLASELILRSKNGINIQLEKRK